MAACKPPCSEVACGPNTYWTGSKCAATPILGADDVVVGAGCFEMGCDPELGESAQPECNADAPLHAVYLDAYTISRHEVTVAQYGQCVSAGECAAPITNADFANPYCNWGQPGREDHPINCVPWAYARAYCAWAGMRLPTEAEWEKAARGADQRIFSWGDADSCENAAICQYDATEPVTSAKNGSDVSYFGVHGMGGNVGEWVHDRYVDDFYATASDDDPLENPSAPPPEAARDPVLFRGGSFQDSRPLPAYSRYWGISMTVNDHTIGFRCAGDLQ